MNLKKIIGAVCIVTGAMSYYLGVQEYVHKKVSVVDIRLDSTAYSYRSVQDNVESTAIIFSTFGMGSGFFLEENYIVTNAHVISASLGELHMSSKSVFILINDIQYRGRIVGVDYKNDVAVIYSPKKGSPVLTYNKKDVKIGEFVYSIGTNRTNYKDIKTGYITHASNEILSNTFITDSILQPGFSGGGTFDKDNILVGINVAGWTNLREPYSFVIDFSKVKGFILAEIVKDKAGLNR